MHSSYLDLSYTSAERVSFALVFQHNIIIMSKRLIYMFNKTFV